MKCCQECGEPLAGRQKQFCSVVCRNKPNGRKTGGWNRGVKTEKRCEECGIVFYVQPSRDRKYNVRACSRKCLGVIQSRERKNTGWHTGPANPTWKGGIQTYQRHRKDACERCGSTKHLCVHHMDEDRYNNELSNLETLCKRCHQIHHRCELNLPQNR